MSTPIVFNEDVQSYKTFPSFEYNGSETGNVYHEDREINGAMYRAANATFNDILKHWTQIAGSQPSYARVQNTDGSIDYLYMPPMGTAAWTTWQGAGQPVIYHAVNYGMSPSNTDNTAALQAALNAAYMSGGGGIIFIPPGTYQFTGTVVLPDPPPPPASDNGIIIAGAGGSTNLQQNNWADLFYFTGLKSGRGVRFRDLRITYFTQEAANPAAAIRVSDCENVTCECVYFYNCPQSLNLDHTANLCGLRDCVIDYPVNGFGGQTMVSIAGTQDFIENCILKQAAQTVAPGGGPANCTGVEITRRGGRRIHQRHAH